MRHSIRCAALVLALGTFASRAEAQAIPLVEPEADAGSAAAPSSPSVPLVAPSEASPAPSPPAAGIPLVTPSEPAPIDAGPPAPKQPIFVPAPTGTPIDAGPPPEDNHPVFVPAPAGTPIDAGPAPAPAPAAAPADAGTFVPGPAAAAPATTVVNADFVKGDLSTLLGADRLVDSFNRVGVSVGYNYLQGISYALVEPQLDLHFFGIALGLQVPLNIEVLDPNVNPKTGQFSFFNHPGQIRPQDWATWQQYARVLNYVTYGHKEDKLYVSVGQVYAETLGHGEIMRRYSPNIDINTTRVSAEVDAYNDYVGFEALTNDVTRWDLIGGLAFVKPAAFFSDNDILRSLSIGVTYAIDRDAPKSLQYASFPGSGLLGCSCQPVEDSNGNLITSNGAVALGGVDAEIKVLKTHDVDIKTYMDYSHLFGGGGGFTVGGLGRFNLGTDPVHAFRLILEGRYLGKDYKPEYFDTFYEVDKYIYDAGISRPATTYVGTPITNLPPPRTQYQMVTQGAEGFGANRFGYYLEASYGVRGAFGATLALEGDTSTNRENFIAHVELPSFWIVQLFASYYKRDMTSFSDAFNLDASTIILAGARIKILPILFVNLRAYQLYVFDSTTAHDYVSTDGVEGDVELGYEF